MHTWKHSRFWALLLVVAMLMTMMPAAGAAEPATYTRITSASELTTGSYVAVVSSGYAMGVLDGSWITAASVTESDGKIVDPAAGTVWTITVDGDTAVLTDSNGTSVAPKSGNNNGIQSGTYSWKVSCTDGMFIFRGQGSDTTTLASNKGTANKFRAYKNTTVNDNPNGYPYTFSLYRLGGAGTVEPEPVLAPKMADAPKGGETVLIYNPANEAVLGTAASGSKQEGVSAKTQQDQIALSDGMAQLEVQAVDGGFAFVQGGRYLTSGATGNSLSFTDTLTDCGKWTFEKQSNGTWYIMNVGAAYNDAHNQALEYYNGFTTYGVKADNPAYQMEFYLVAPATLLKQGDRVVIYNPAYQKSLSTTYTGFYNNGGDIQVDGETVTGYTANDIWTVGVNADGSYTFSTADGKKLSMGASYTSTPLDDVNPNWAVLEAETPGCYYIKNTARNQYLEWYEAKGNWSAYGTIGANEQLFAQKFFHVTGDPVPGGELPEAGEQVVLYNVSAKGVLASQDSNESSPSITNAAAEIVDGKAVCSNGARVFTVEKNGEYFRFKTAHDGYLCSNGTGNNAFYQLSADENADWTLASYNGGYTLESRTAKFNGQYSQFLEYFGGAYKTYSMYNVTDKDIYTFRLLPCTDDVTDGVVNTPAVTFGALPEAYQGQAYGCTFTVDAVFGVAELTVTVNGQNMDVTLENGSYSLMIPAEQVQGEKLMVAVSGQDTVGVTFGATVEITVKDEPVISELTPASGAQTGEDKRPVISAVIGNAGENPQVQMQLNGQTVPAVYDGSTVRYTPAEDLADGRVSVTVTVRRADGKTATATWNFTVGKAQYQLYFGQLHSHTQYSDGSGTLDSALRYVQELPESANVQFVAFTDHSNYFDKSGEANPEGALYDMTQATAYSQGLWSEFKQKIADFNASQTDVVALGGFEMTWSGGPGHINTFATPGIVSRNNTTLNNKTDYAGMRAYYSLLGQPEGIDSISQFNHPGSTFGTFGDFAFWDALIDTRMYLVEVGNGEGAIGAGGYYPSYEYYTMALDKGWHVAPTNNQDNHKGKWGNANDARDVVLTDDFSEEGLYAAIRALRVYATEDKNLEIHYQVNGLPLGSSISEVPEKLNLEVQVNDPDRSDSISKVEVVVNSGKTVYTWDDPAVLATGELTATLDPDYSYYFIRVTQGDGDLAVTAPVWVGETLKLGISSLECGTATPVTGESMTLTTTLFNSEATEATVQSITYTFNGSQVLAAQTNPGSVPASGSAAYSVDVRFDTAKVYTVTATVILVQDGKEYTFTKDITLDVLDADKLVYVGIDASHYNEYVSGNYKDSMGNFSNLAAEYSIRTVELKTSEDLIAACGNEKYKALILTAPSRRLAEAQADPRSYSDAELNAIDAFNRAGGVVILAGWSDYYENYEAIMGNPNAKHMAETQNAVLEKLGAALRINDDATHDDALNGGQTQRLYFNTYGNSFLTKGVEVDPAHPNDRMYTEVFSHYGGASIYAQGQTVLADNITGVVYGHSSTYSKDSDGDGRGQIPAPMYDVAEGDSRLLIMATETLPNRGLIVVSGAAFMSNFEVQATIEDNGSEKNYSNYRICQNLLATINPVLVTDIAQVQAQTEAGYKYTIEGVVTSNASGYDKDTAFFDCVYIQDDTAGICCFPVAGNYKIGDKVRVTGTTDSYQGEMELQVTSMELLSEGNPVEARPVTAKQINERTYLGSLVTLQGTVESFEVVNGLVQTIMVRDSAGDTARVFIDGYITTGQDVQNLQNGASITVTGLSSYDDTFAGPFARIRVRNRADVVVTEMPQAFAITGQPQDTAVRVDTDAVFTISTNREQVRYQWQFSNTDGRTWADSTCAGAQTRELTVPMQAYRDGQLYRCVVTDSEGTTLISQAAKMTLALPEIVIVRQPVSVTAAAGEMATFTVEAQGENLHYQWQFSNTSGKTWGNSSSAGANTASLQVPMQTYRNGQMYRCVITNETGRVITQEVVLSLPTA